jgi:glycosyltransferase involved in cell wall biosynthesis
VKVLFISRATIFKDKGGDTVQLVNTANYLRKLGVEVDIKLCDENIDYATYDLLHFFNIIRPADILLHIEKSRKSFVVSTIFVDYSEYEKKERKGIAGLLFKILPADIIEYLKVIARAIVNNEKIISPSYLYLGQKGAVRRIIKGSKMLLPNSDNEYQRLSSHYNIEQAYMPIPNAIDPELFDSTVYSSEKDSKMILCVGRIEGRKNQLNLIRAIKNSPYHLYIIGAAAANQAAYFEACKKAASTNVSFISNIPQEQLLAYYRSAKVHILPSWFETTGLSSLEAAVMGCNIVITDKGDTKAYFEDMAFYCDPASPESIREAIDRAASQPFREALRIKILNEYTWSVAAARTLDAYKAVLSQ